MHKLKIILPNFYQKIKTELSLLGLHILASELQEISLSQYSDDQKTQTLFLYTNNARELNSQGSVTIDTDNFDRILRIKVLAGLDYLFISVTS